MKKLLSVLCAVALGVAFSGTALVAGTTKVACVGDSITYGSTIANREKDAYPVVLGQLLGDSFEVKNFGNPGKTCGDYPREKGRKRWLGDNKEHANAVAFEADIYIANLGINDTGAWWNPKLFTEGYERLIADWQGKRQGKIAFFMWTRLAPDFRGPVGKTAFPGNVFAPDYKFPLKDNGSSANRKEAEKLLKGVAEKAKAIPMDAYTPLAAHPEMYSADGLHPNATGARRIAEFTFAKLATSKLPAGVKIHRGTPKLSASADGKSVVLENSGKVAILLDDAWVLRGNGNAEFAFEQATVIAPGEKITIELAGKADQKDPGSPLVSAKLKQASEVKLVPKKK